MIEIRQTDDYVAWFERLRDHMAKTRILIRIRRVSLGEEHEDENDSLGCGGASEDKRGSARI